MTGKLWLLVAGLAVALPAVHNTAIRRQVVEPGGPKPGSFNRGAVESRPEATLSGQRRLPLRDAVEYRPNPDHVPVPVKLRLLNEAAFMSQFSLPSLHVDYFRQTYPALALLAPLPLFYTVVSKGDL